MPGTRRLGRGQADLYSAEAETIDRVARRWRRLADAQASVDELINSEWFFDRWPWFVRGVVERRGSGSVWSTCQPLDGDGPDGRPTEGVVLVAARALNQATVLHELAHLLVAGDAGHGPAFAETLLTLVRHEMGFFAFADFYHALRRRPGFASIAEGIDVEAAHTL